MFTNMYKACKDGRIPSAVAFPVRKVTPGRRQSKTPILSRNVDQKSLETEFSIAICCQLMAIENTVSIDFFYLCLAIVDSIFDCRQPGVKVNPHGNFMSEPV